MEGRGGVEHGLIGVVEEGIEIGRQEPLRHAVAQHALGLEAIGEGEVEAIE